MFYHENDCILQSEGNLMSKLQSLSAADTRVLLSKYFDKVIALRESERKKELTCSELEVTVVLSCFCKVLHVTICPVKCHSYNVDVNLILSSHVFSSKLDAY